MTRKHPDGNDTPSGCLRVGTRIRLTRRMADLQSARRGRGGRPSRGDRVAQTIRFPRDMHEALSADMADAGFNTFQDYVVALVQRARAEGIKPETRQEPLPCAV